MKRAVVIFMLLISLPAVRGTLSAQVSNNPGPGERVLMVVAHPDDESEMAGTVYRIAKELSGTVDQVIISDGEGGYRYSFLAGRYYGADLSSEPVGRALLPQIRKDEARHAARDLGIHKQWFLNERDERFTLDVNEVLQKTWRTERVRSWLARRLSAGHYDLVFVLLPTPDTHGQHKAASILALQAVEQLPEEWRPTVLGVQASPQEDGTYGPLPDYPITAATSAGPVFRFDRNKRFGFQNALSYQIVVDWVIAEHKSQGLFQMTYGQNRYENFWVFGASTAVPNPEADPALKKIWSDSPKVD